MNSIFVRIYGGMIAAIFLIVVTVYAAFATTNYFRMLMYRSKIAAGPMALIGEMASRQESAVRSRWVQALSKRMDMEMRLVDAEWLGISEEERDVLARGELLLRQDDDGRRGVGIIRVQGEDDQFVYGVGEHITESQARGLAYLMAEHLASFPPDAWPALLERINQLFGFPVQRAAAFAETRV